jgi:enamine deaminase RidA (YjgF/YER057c/UK114 family)
MATTLAPAEWPRPRGYANGMAVDGPGRLIVLAGQIGSEPGGMVVADDLAGQCRQAFRNILRLLQEAGAGPQNVLKLTWFVTSRDEYNAQGREIGAAYRDTFGKHFPAMTVIFVSALVDARAKVEIEASAFVGFEGTPAMEGP